MKNIITLITATVLILAGCAREEKYLFPLEAGFSVVPDAPVSESEVVFEVTVKGGEFPYTYEWDFGDGLTGSKYIESVVYMNSGDKNVKLKVTDSRGSSVTVEKVVPVLDIESIPRLAKPEVSIKSVSHNAVTVAWEPVEDDYGDGTYEFEFLNATNTVLNAVTKGQFASPYKTALSIGNLMPSSSYKFRVRAISSDEAEKLSSYWAEAEFTTSLKPSEDSEAVLVERFDGFIWTTDYFSGGYGFRPNDKAQKTTVSLNVTADEFKPAGTTTGDYFGTFSKDFRTSTGILSDWECSKIYGCLGFGKLSTGSAAGYLTTPELAKVNGVKDIELSFKASPYYEWKDGSVDDSKILVEAVGAGTVENGEIDLSSAEPLVWHDCKVIVKNATSSTRLKISAAVASKGRFFIDDIMVTASETSAPTLVVNPVSGEFKPEGGEITIELSSNEKWELRNLPSWIESSAISGDAGSFNLVLTAGKADEDRSAVIDFVTLSGTDDVSVSVALEQKFVKPFLSAPLIRVLKKTHNTVIYEWDDVTGEYFDRKYGFECVGPDGSVLNVIKEYAFKNLHFKNNIAFSNLKPSTVYTIRMRALSSDESLCSSSEWAELQVPTEPEPVIPEDFILSESFHNFVWAGDYVEGGYGFCPTSTKTASSLDLAADKFYSPDNSTGDYYNTGSFPGNFVSDVVGLKGWSGSKVYGHAGYPKFGTGSAAGWIKTCRLEKVAGTQDIELSFLLCPYFSWKTGAADNGRMIVSVEGAGTVVEGGEWNFSDLSVGQWTPVKVIIAGATSKTQIKFTSEGKGQRFFIDDIVVKLTK